MFCGVTGLECVGIGHVPGFPLCPLGHSPGQARKCPYQFADGWSSEEESDFYLLFRRKTGEEDDGNNAISR